jgi:hypothetical protein
MPTFPLNADGLTNVIRYIGEENTPRSTRSLRSNVQNTMLHLGTPVIIKHMYNDYDVQNGVAIPSPNYDDVYGQVQNDDPLSHGVGFVSVETSLDEWVSPDGQLVVSAGNPGAGYVPAPKYRGYGPGYLTYVIFPDAAEDVFKPNEVGALIRIQRAQIQMGWYPEVNDNDLIVVVEIDDADRVIATHERFLARSTNPVSIHGTNRQGRREYGEDFGNRRVVNQNFEVTLLPANHQLYNVELDR